MKLFESSRVEKLAALFLLVASILVGLHAIAALKGLFDPAPLMGNMISVEGAGTVQAVPDIARVTFSVLEEAETAADAQEQSAQKVNTALALLEDYDIDEKDIKTTSYNVSPKYARQQPCFNGICPEYEQRIVGFTTNQTIELKIRDVDAVGEILSLLGEAGVSNLYGPSFTIDDPDALKAEARALAIEDAQSKAKALAKDLNVRLVRVTGFWENSGGYYPDYARAESFGFGGDTAVSSVPEIPTGENEVKSNVSITYEIR